MFVDFFLSIFHDFPRFPPLLGLGARLLRGLLRLQREVLGRHGGPALPISLG